MKVSVAMCTYNGENFIEEQLKSILNQTRTVNEIIICDDGSSDSTLKICEKILQNQNIHYGIFKNEVSLKVLRNFEKAFSLCTGEIIFSCDQDDIWEPNKVQKIMEHFEKNEHIEMIATNASLISENGELMNLSLKESIGFSMNDSDEVIDSLLRTFCITGATMAFRKSFQSQSFYLSDFWLHDGWLSLISALNNSFLYLNDKLTKYRLHSNNACGISHVKVLHYGTVKELQKAKRKKVIMNALKTPFYSEDMAQQREDMYIEIKDYILDNNLVYKHSNMVKLESCINFWKERKTIRKMGFQEICKYIRENKKEKLYTKYCEGDQFKYLDLYFWFVYHVIPRRNRG